MTLLRIIEEKILIRIEPRQEKNTLLITIIQGGFISIMIEEVFRHYQLMIAQEVHHLNIVEKFRVLWKEIKVIIYNFINYNILIENGNDSSYG